MKSMRDIKRQIASVENTKKITKAMKLVAAAKLRRLQERAENAKPFFEKTRKTLANVTAKIDNRLHPLLEERDVKKVGYFLITGDRGLAGPYNNRVIKEVETSIEADQKENNLITVGKKGRDYFKRQDVEIISEYLELEDSPTFHNAANFAQEVVELYQEEIFDEIYLVYTDFKSVINQEVKKIKLLPVDPDDMEPENPDTRYLYEPSPEEVLSVVLPQYIKNIIFGALLQSKASEFASRMTAMDSATDNAEEMIEELTLSYNRARQAAITQELSEIVGGAEALE
ncbi:ATP synthase F1 subunit gamma [Natroniella sulfidigena]|uniref:ATP synthase F1 subunit gamma n=1 Tax=Natroniella sulfidigena TaxID=723921 RepID=UPI00200A3EF6|nr:ATP synthase F1 subunit gamma [Natroniella sulfidigena]MCK8816392.1 ATP synthase F1 subunit gamma [Natroniella sulfidigena]